MEIGRRSAKSPLHIGQSGAFRDPALDHLQRLIVMHYFGCPCGLSGFQRSVTHSITRRKRRAKKRPTPESWSTMRSFPRIPILLFFMRFLMDPNAAWAHAIIVSSSPAAGATVAGDHLPICLRFNSRIDHARSKLTLFAPDGSPRGLTAASDSPADELNADAKLLSTGAWRLRWQVLSVDGHITRGDIPFTVR